MPAQKRRELRGQSAKAQSPSPFAVLIRDTSRLWRKHHLSYDQTKYIVEQVRHRLNVAAPGKRRRTVDRLNRSEVERLIGSAYQNRSQEGLLIKTLFLTGARVSEFVHIRVEDLGLESDPPQIHIAHPKGNAYASPESASGVAVREQPPSTICGAQRAGDGQTVCSRGRNHQKSVPAFASPLDCDDPA